MRKVLQPFKHAAAHHTQGKHRHKLNLDKKQTGRTAEAYVVQKAALPPAAHTVTLDKRHRRRVDWTAHCSPHRIEKPLGLSTILKEAQTRVSSVRAMCTSQLKYNALKSSPLHGKIATAQMQPQASAV
jgi:hypothetical protein